MGQLISLLIQGLTTTALDVDNALYMTSMVESLEPDKQRRAIFWGLFLELLGRLGLIAIFTFLFSGTEPLFELFGITFTAETLSLLGAGIFLFIRSSRDLVNFFRHKGVEDSSTKSHPTVEKSLLRLMLEMTTVNLILSIDTVIAVNSVTSEFEMVLYLLIFSALFRLLFVRQIAQIMSKYPSLTIVILTFLILIGVELTLQGLGLSIPEAMFNTALLLGVIGAALYAHFSNKAESNKETSQ
jgi:predicted tellurium resistance membrane protein TerC